MANKQRTVPKRGDVQLRTVPIPKGAVNVDKRTADLAFSSETPVPRWFGIEILSHDPGCMELTRLASGGPLLLNHNSDVQVGVVESARCDPDKMGRATVRFSRSALGEEVFRDVLDGIRQNVSVGYSIDEDPVQMKPEEMDEELKTLALKEQAPVYLIRAWTPMEISMAPVPADIKVGVGRTADLPFNGGTIREEIVDAAADKLIHGLTNSTSSTNLRAVQVNSSGKSHAMSFAKAGKVRQGFPVVLLRGGRGQDPGRRGNEGLESVCELASGRGHGGEGGDEGPIQVPLRQGRKGLSERDPRGEAACGAAERERCRGCR